MGFPRQEYWIGLPFPSPGDLPNPGIKPASPTLTGGFFITELPGKPQKILNYMLMTHSSVPCCVKLFLGARFTGGETEAQRSVTKS